jgi:hypothetical protein
VTQAIVVWKHQLDREVTELHLPRGATVLHVAEQHGHPCLWEAHAADQVETERRVFQLVGTGHQAVVEPARHVGSVLAQGGYLVLHVFEVS